MHKFTHHGSWFSPAQTSGGKRPSARQESNQRKKGGQRNSRRRGKYLRRKNQKIGSTARNANFSGYMFSGNHLLSVSVAYIHASMCSAVTGAWGDTQSGCTSTRTDRRRRLTERINRWECRTSTRMPVRPVKGPRRMENKSPATV